MPHKVFVSYAHSDNLFAPPEPYGWVSALVGLLQARLPMEVGRQEEVEVWTDHQLNHHETLDNQIQAALDDSSTFIMVASIGYLASHWCKRVELPQFLKNHFADHVFRVERKRIDDPNGIPQPLRGALGFKFWHLDPLSKRMKTLGVPVHLAQQDFYDALDGLVQELGDLIRRRGSNSPPHAGGLRDSKTARPVYLAEAADDVSQIREDLKRFLKQVGIRAIASGQFARLLEAIDPALAADFDWEEREKYARALRDILANQNAVFVQLLGDDPGRRFSDNSYCTLVQYEVAKSVGCPILQWRLPDAELSSNLSKWHRELLELCDFSTIQEFKTRVVSECHREIEKPQRLTFTALPGGKIEASARQRVFVNHYRDDEDIAKDLVAILNQDGFEVILPADSGDARSDLEKHLHDCHALILVHGIAPSAWTREQLNQARKILLARPGRPPASALYDGPPLMKPPTINLLPQMLTINCRDGFSPEKLRLFLQTV